MSEAALAVEHLCIEWMKARNTAIPIVSDVSFRIESGAIAGLFGESGCGKTTLAMALLKLLPHGRYHAEGSVRIGGREIRSLGEREMERIRGADVSVVFQDPGLSLNPVMRVRHQVGEVVRAHRGAASPAELLELAGLPSSDRILNAYPHQLSGGERQRVAIAQALACQPRLVIADEPFTALDAIRVVELIDLFRGHREKLGTAFLVISHHPGILARVADQMLLMRGGTILSGGPPRDVFRNTKALPWGNARGV
ncbi:MAG TPA: ABC transporter ATP-binding protein [Bryobacteraceae bacterium]|nr:ABC transporter ATP-binding protein [Bryobacteraceae bacterium]